MCSSRVLLRWILGSSGLLVETPGRPRTERWCHCRRERRRAQPCPRGRRERLQEPGRSVPAGAPAALLPDPRIPPRRRGPGPGDAARGLARVGRLRGTCVVARLAVPDRDQPLPERAARPLPPRADGLFDGRAARAHAAKRAGAGSSRTPTRCSKGSRTPPPGRTRATRCARRSASRSWPRCSSCRRASGPRSCCATCSATAPPRWPRCSTAAKPPSKGRSSERARPSTSGCPRAAASARPGRALPASSSSSPASPPRSSAATPTASSRCSPMTPG